MPPVFKDHEGHVRNGWKIAGCGLLTVGLIAGLSALAQVLLPRGRALPEPYVAFAAALLASWICVRLEKRTLASIGLRIDGRTLRLAGGGLLTGAALLLCTAALVWALGGFHLVRAPEVSGLAMLASGGVMLGVALFEETLFRGYVLQRAVQGLGPRAALALVSLVFMLVHQMDASMGPAQRATASANIFMAGVLLGLCYLRSGSLALPIGLHLGWNWAMESLGFSISGVHAADSLWVPVFDSRAAWLTGGDFGLEASVASLPVLAAAVVWIALRPPAGLQSRA